MNIDLRQHRIASGVICGVSLWICYISFTQSPAEAYNFPRIISVVLVLTASFTFIKAMLGQSKVGDGLSMVMAKNMAPGIVIGFIHLFWAAKFLGFYTATTLAFFILLSVYDPKPNNKAMTWIRRAIITIANIAVMYALFALVLKVFTPQGVFI